MSSERHVILVSEDERTFPVPLSVASMSGTLRNLLEEVIDGDDDSALQPIPLRNVHGDVLEAVLRFCEHHRADPAPAHDAAGDAPPAVARSAAVASSAAADAEPAMSEWDRAFCDVELSRLFALILAANYLDIAPLLEVTCKAVAAEIEKRSAPELRELFNIENDYSPEEEMQVRKELAWCEDL